MFFYSLCSIQPSGLENLGEKYDEMERKSLMENVGECCFCVCPNLYIKL